MRIKHLLQHTLLVAPIGLLAACSGDTDTTAASSSNGGSFSLAVTDAPVDNAAKVIIEFTGVTIKPEGADPIEFNFNAPVSVDLLALQGQISQYLVADEDIPAGHYQWMKFSVNAELDDHFDSYIEFEDGTQKELDISGDDHALLKLVGGFDVLEDGSVDLTVDFDLRRSLKSPEDGSEHYSRMRPSLRMVHSEEAGSIEGTIDPMLISEMCGESSEGDGAVYVYPSQDTEESNADTDSESTPIASALVEYRQGRFQYEVGFLPENDYRIAFTCDTDRDDPESDDDIIFWHSDDNRVRVGRGEHCEKDMNQGEGRRAENGRYGDYTPAEGDWGNGRPEQNEDGTNESGEFERPEMRGGERPEWTRPEMPTEDGAEGGEVGNEEGNDSDTPEMGNGERPEWTRPERGEADLNEESVDLEEEVESAEVTEE